MTLSMPELTEADIREWAGEPSFGRGQEYFGDGHVVDPRVRPPTLKADCLGSGRSLYTVQVMLSDRCILAATCSCPVDDAVDHLGRVRASYSRLGATASWQTFVTELRERYRRLPALQDELTRARL